MLIEQYPVGWAIGVGKPEPALAFLVDVPGIAMQGKTWVEAVAKLQAFAPSALAVYRKEGKLPQPSREPALHIASIKWISRPLKNENGSPRLRVATDGELALIA
jgi:predicted RNase H-like HicB family nuclease